MHSEELRRLQTVESELKRIKSSYRRLQTLIVLLAAVACLAASKQPGDAEVRAQNFLVVNEKGQTVARLGSGPHGGLLELSEPSHHQMAVGFKAESGELRISDVAHGDELLFISLMGTHCFGQLTLQPPNSSQASPQNGFRWDCSDGYPSAAVQEGQQRFQGRLGAQGWELEPSIYDIVQSLKTRQPNK